MKMNRLITPILIGMGLFFLITTTQARQAALEIRALRSTTGCLTPSEVMELEYEVINHYSKPSSIFCYPSHPIIEPLPPITPIDCIAGFSLKLNESCKKHFRVTGNRLHNFGADILNVPVTCCTTDAPTTCYQTTYSDNVNVRRC